MECSMKRSVFCVALFGAYLGTFKAADFAGADERKTSLPSVTAYEILRHNVVDLGKRNFIGSIPMGS